MEIRVSRRLDLARGRSWRGRGRAGGVQRGAGGCRQGRGRQGRGAARTQPREEAAGHSWEVPGQGEQMPRATPLPCSCCNPPQPKPAPITGVGAHREPPLLVGDSAGTWDSPASALAAPQKAERGYTVQRPSLTPSTGQLMPGSRGN